MKRFLKKICPKAIHRMYGEVKYWLMFQLCPKSLASAMFRGIMGYEMDWDNPQDLNQKINWMKFNYDTAEWSRLADKVLVRDYVKERLGEEYLPKVYAVWKDAASIDISNLPDKFVIKTNHGCGTVIPVSDKKSCDVDAIKKQCEVWLKKKYGYETVELHYLKIKPLVYAEELLENDSECSSSLVDYNVFCIEGKAQCILVCRNRVIGEKTQLSFYDLDWNLKNDMIAGRHAGESMKMERPACLDELLVCAEKLAKGHPQVRVDFYIVHNKIYFGEMTFTSQGGYMDYLAKPYSLEMGKQVKLPNL